MTPANSLALPSRIRARAPAAFVCAVIVFLTGFAPRVAAASSSHQQPSGSSPSKQSPTPQDPASSRTQTTEQRVGEALALLSAQIRAKESERAELADPATAATESERAARRTAIAEVARELTVLRRQFSSIASGVDVQEFESATNTKFDLQEELKQVLEPIVEGLKDVTEAPREIERLRTDLEALGRRRLVASNAIQRIDAKLEAISDPPPEPTLRQELSLARQHWFDRMQEIRSREAVTSEQLAIRESGRRSILESGTEAVSEFFRTRGLNLVIGLAAMLLVLGGLRFAGRRVSSMTKLRKSQRLSFYRRLGSVLFGIFVATASVGAMLLAFYAVNDWLLLLLTLVFLLGVSWASLKMLPQFFDQVRLLLNLGAVREGERIVRDGIPWRVERLHFYTYLVNPKLTGGLLRLPLKELIDLRSRPIGSDEPWFPTSRGDWVILPNDNRGEVILQTPDLVQIRRLGNAIETYSAEEFLTMGIRNLSHGFRVSVTFGVDYAHQAKVTREIPAIMQDRLTKDLNAQVPAEQIVGIKVEFKEAGASSLDFQVLADFTGEAARDYDKLTRAISRILVDACNDHDWVIPFTQITLHQSA